jgi:hypothetical protein
MYMSEIINLITQKLLEEPEFKQMHDKMMPCFGKVLGYDFKKREATIRFFNPLDGSSMIKENVPVKTQRGLVAGSLEVGDNVLLVFPGGSTDSPLIVSVYDEEEYGYLGGSYQTSIIF